MAIERPVGAGLGSLRLNFSHSELDADLQTAIPVGEFILSGCISPSTAAEADLVK